MIWWRGHGILVPIIGFGLIIIFEIAMEFFRGERIIDSPNVWICGIALCLAGGLVYLLAPKIPKGALDMDGKPIKSADVASFCSLSLQVWALLLAGFGIFSIACHLLGLA
ncbi:MAG: hypothetical protein LBL49_02845 [Clostridiales Family XIII bacterium]|jgi:hypothetical protein|nr:hypothetical protein [Clostridiales Family XIII bacterium]